jgi:CHASE3 domain sensor protein
MKKSLPLRLYAGLGLAIFLVLLVAAFTINSLQKQEEETLAVDHSMKVVEQLRDIRYTFSQMRSARRTYWITGNDSFLDILYSGNAVIPNRLLDLKKEVADDPVQVINMNRLDSSLSSLFTFWGGRGKIDAGMSKEKLAELTNQEEEMSKRVYAFFEVIKAEEGKLLVLK